MNAPLETKQDELWNKDWEDLLDRLKTQITSSRWTKVVLTPCPTCGHVRLQRIGVSEEQGEGE